MLAGYIVENTWRLKSSAVTTSNKGPYYNMLFGYGLNSKEKKHYLTGASCIHAQSVTSRMIQRMLLTKWTGQYNTFIICTSHTLKVLWLYLTVFLVRFSEVF